MYVWVYRPVADSVTTFLMVVHLTTSPSDIKLYTCHRSSPGNNHIEKSKKRKKKEKKIFKNLHCAG